MKMNKAAMVVMVAARTRQTRVNFILESFQDQVLSINIEFISFIPFISNWI